MEVKWPTDDLSSLQMIAVQMSAVQKQIVQTEIMQIHTVQLTLCACYFTVLCHQTDVVHLMVLLCCKTDLKGPRLDILHSHMLSGQDV